MIIWQGWGILAVAYVFLAAMLFGGVGSSFLPESAIPYSVAIGMLLAAVATWFTGIRMNRTGPQRQVDEWAAQRESELDGLVRTGRFSLGPGRPQPSSEAEARQMADALLEHERSQTAGAFNRHRVFWIPMQYFAVLWVGIAMFAVTAGMTSGS